MSNQHASRNAVNDRFLAQSAESQDTQPVGLLKLDDLRQKRAQSGSQNERSLSDGPNPDEKASVPRIVAKKKRKQPAVGKLSFGEDDDQEESIPLKKSRATTVKGDDADQATSKRLGSNAAVMAPKIMTKAAQSREAERKEQLRKEFLVMQEAVKTTDFEIPFVFFDGANNPGGCCRMKKGEHVWLFLDRCRKIGADLGAAGVDAGRSGSRREWARISVDDLMIVRGEIIIPHHYDFYYFIAGKIKDHTGRVLFPYTTEAAIPTKSDPTEDLETYDPLTAYKESKKASEQVLEGSDEDPTYTKVVDRRWYERNKHVFPASAWEQFDPAKDYSTTTRRDAGGNVYFFS